MCLGLVCHILPSREWPVEITPANVYPKWNELLVKISLYPVEKAILHFFFTSKEVLAFFSSLAKSKLKPDTGQVRTRTIKYRRCLNGTCQKSHTFGWFMKVIECRAAQVKPTYERTQKNVYTQCVPMPILTPNWIIASVCTDVTAVCRVWRNV